MVQHFRAGGNGGQNQNKRDTGTRVIHPPSGARAEARDERSQWQNKKSAFRKMLQTREFQLWLKIQTGRIDAAHAEAQRLQIPVEHLRFEVRRGGRWVVVSEDQLT